MIVHWPIRYKLLVGAALLCLAVTVLAVISFRGVYAYRGLAKSVSRRAAELPLAQQLSRHVSDLRVTLSKVRREQDFAAQSARPVIDTQILREEFRSSYLDAQETLRRYSEQIAANRAEDYESIGDTRAEQATVGEINRSLALIEVLFDEDDWMVDDIRVEMLGDELDNLDGLCSELPSHLQSRMHSFAGDVRMQYRTWIFVTWFGVVLAAVLLGGLVQWFWMWIFRPLRTLIRGSKRVAGGEFDYRIQLSSRDEMSDLADAMNGMTARFQAIRDDLDHQVKERTKQVVRSEQLASVGFLAAGVAHEINNPLASIAFAAESLEDRLQELLDELRLIHATSANGEPGGTPGDLPADGPNDESAENGEHAVLRQYVKMIQDEAFRCKDITEKLLDYSRLGDVDRQPIDLVDLVSGVIDMVKHLGKYRQKNIELTSDDCVMAPVNSQEIKQVVLNLITNALDSLDAGGTVRVEVVSRGLEAEIVVSDNGCGMTEEILKHLFEPFFTRRRDGSGTGLGLSITYRIIADHGGQIDAHSEGPGHGSRFRITLPKQTIENEQIRQRAA